VTTNKTLTIRIADSVRRAGYDADSIRGVEMAWDRNGLPVIRINLEVQRKAKRNLHAVHRSGEYADD
jgi:hypothetical protein